MMQGMKKELRAYNALLQGIFDWDSVPGAAEFNKKLTKQNL